MPFDIIIIGAGVAGLSAAVALAPHGHAIRIFEKAHSFEHEGSGILSIPSANRVLHDWRVDKTILKPFRPDIQFQRRMDDCSLIAEQDIALKQKELGIEFHGLVVDRSDLHASLYDKISRAGNVQFRFGIAVVAIDTKSARIELQDGSTAQGDLIIASDGIHSVAFNSFPHLSIPSYIAVPQRRPIRLNNCVLDVAECISDPMIADLFRRIQYAECGRGGGVFVDNVLSKEPQTPSGPKDPLSGTGYVFLPMRDKKSISVNSFRPEPLAEFEDGPWTTALSLEEYIDEIHGDQLAEALERTLRKGRFCERWTLGIRDCSTTFVQHKVVLIGDAAHPLNPSIGSGTGLAIEDGACLGVLIADANCENLSHRLKLFNELRYERCVGMKALSEWTRPPGTGTSECMFRQLCPGRPMPERKDLFALEGLYDTVKETKAALQRERDENGRGIWTFMRRLMCTL